MNNGTAHVVPSRMNGLFVGKKEANADSPTVEEEEIKKLLQATKEEEAQAHTAHPMKYSREITGMKLIDLMRQADSAGLEIKNRAGTVFLTRKLEAVQR